MVIVQLQRLRIAGRARDGHHRAAVLGPAGHLGAKAARDERLTQPSIFSLPRPHAPAVSLPRLRGRVRVGRSSGRRRRNGMIRSMRSAQAPPDLARRHRDRRRDRASVHEWRAPPSEPPKPTGAAIAGRARVVDGDSLEIGTARIRLFGIDAPEGRQQCRDAQGRGYACGADARRALADLIGGREVSCTPVGASHDRSVALCTAQGRDLSEAMVRCGHALELRAAQPRPLRRRRARGARRPARPVGRPLRAAGGVATGAYAGEEPPARSFRGASASARTRNPSREWNTSPAAAVVLSSDKERHHETSRHHRDDPGAVRRPRARAKFRRQQRRQQRRRNLRLARRLDHRPDQSHRPGAGPRRRAQPPSPADSSTTGRAPGVNPGNPQDQSAARQPAGHDAARAKNPQERDRAADYVPRGEVPAAAARRAPSAQHPAWPLRAGQLRAAGGVAKGGYR